MHKRKEKARMKINNVERIEYDLVTLEDETLLRRSVDGQWQQNMWSDVDAWWWMDLSSTDSRTIELEELYRGWDPDEYDEELASREQEEQDESVY